MDLACPSLPTWPAPIFLPRSLLPVFPIACLGALSLLVLLVLFFPGPSFLTPVHATTMAPAPWCDALHFDCTRGAHIFDSSGERVSFFLAGWIFVAFVAERQNFGDADLDALVSHEAGVVCADGSHRAFCFQESTTQGTHADGEQGGTRGRNGW